MDTSGFLKGQGSYKYPWLLSPTLVRALASHERHAPHRVPPGSSQPRSPSGLPLLCSCHPGAEHPAGGPLQQGEWVHGRGASFLRHQQVRVSSLDLHGKLDLMQKFVQVCNCCHFIAFFFFFLTTVSSAWNPSKSCKNSDSPTRNPAQTFD